MPTFENSNSHSQWHDFLFSIKAHNFLIFCENRCPKQLWSFCLNKTKWNIQHNIFFKEKESLGYKNKIYELNNSFYFSIHTVSRSKTQPNIFLNKILYFSKSEKDFVTWKANFSKKKIFLEILHNTSSSQNKF